MTHAQPLITLINWNYEETGQLGSKPSLFCTSVFFYKMGNDEFFPLIPPGFNKTSETNKKRILTYAVNDKT